MTRLSSRRGTDTAGSNNGPFTASGVTENASGDDVTGVENSTGTLAFTDADWHDTHTIGDVANSVDAVVAAAGEADLDGNAGHGHDDGGRHDVYRRQCV